MREIEFVVHQKQVLRDKEARIERQWRQSEERAEESEQARLLRRRISEENASQIERQVAESEEHR